MSRQFLTSYDECGDLTGRGGWVIAKGGPEIRVGPADSAEGAAAAVGGDIPVPESGGTIYLGGSGRNLMVSGMPGTDYNGAWRHGYPGTWQHGDLQILHVTGGATTIRDAVDVLAELATGGPLGSLASTAYGEGLLGSAFTAVLAAEWSAPGVLPRAAMESGASGLNAQEFTGTDAANYVSDLDPLLTIHIDEDGAAQMLHDGVVIAIREDGPNNNPAGEFDSTTDGLPWNPKPPVEDDGELVETNPFGVLTLVYSWPATPDLDTTTEFLGEKVGYPGPYLASYMTHSGDETAPSGSETVVIDLATAWDDEVISDVADVVCKADWFPSGSTGPATLDVTYSLPGFTPLSLTILPGNVHPGATTAVAALRISSAGTITQHFAPWTATVSRLRVPPPEGVVYLTEVDTAGALTSVEGPIFAATKPADTADEFHIPLATSDGAGVLETIWSGMILRR